MKNVTPVVLLEDNHCFAISRPGNVFLGVVHRLDRPVSGTLLFARTSKAASRLSDQFRRGAVRKTYIALVEGCVSAASGELVDWLTKDRPRNHVTVAASSATGARECRLAYRIIETGSSRSLLEICPLTGRSHQIRVQLANLGHPIVGDVRYGAEDRLGSRIMLHAARLEFTHPTLKADMTIECHPPDAFGA